jgi:hypothetical protein
MIFPRSTQSTMKLMSVLLLAIAASTCAAFEPASLQAGAAAVDITPQEFPLNLPGGFNANMAERAHDPLHARALVLSDSTTTLAIVVVDNLGLAREVADEAKAMAAKQCGIAAENIMLAATHTHSAPPSSAQGPAGPAAAYRKQLLAGIAESIVRAHANQRPVAVGHAAEPLPDEVFNRRWFLKPGKMPLNPFGQLDQVKMNPGTSAEVLDRPAGPTDPDVTILAVRDQKTRKPVALLASYSLHYVGGVPRGEVSADYFGEFARLMPSRLRAGEDFVAMLCNGTSGDINNIPFLVNRPPREPYEQIRIVARKTADTAWRAWKGIGDYQQDAPLDMVQRQIVLRRRRPTAEQIARAKKIVAMTDEAEVAKLPRLAQAYARRTLALAQADEPLEVQLQAIRIGDLAVCTIPFETFVEIGLELKRRSPFDRTMVVGIANGSHGYLPTPEQHRLGGYETWLGTSRVQLDASVIITNELLGMLDELARKDQTE